MPGQSGLLAMYCLPLLSTPRRPQQFNWFDYVMFHGDEWPKPRSWDSRKRKRPTLSLWRNTYWVPAVFAPSATLVLRSDLGSVLSGMGAVIQPVTFATCFSLPYGEPGSEPPPARVWPTGSDLWAARIRKLPKTPPPSEPFVEIIAPRLVDLAVTAGHDLDLSSLSLFGAHFSKRSQLSAEVLALHPVIAHDDGYLFSPAAFKAVGDVIDRRYFGVHQLKATPDGVKIEPPGA